MLWVVRFYACFPRSCSKYCTFFRLIILYISLQVKIVFIQTFRKSGASYIADNKTNKLKIVRFLLNKGRIIMKKLLTTGLLMASAIIFVPSIEAKSAETSNTAISANSAPQIYVQRRRRPLRIVNRTRIVRVGYRTYRETIQTRYQPNGRVTTRVISRIRIR
jgi:hypothetical protein